MLLCDDSVHFWRRNVFLLCGEINNIEPVYAASPFCGIKAVAYHIHVYLDFTLSSKMSSLIIETKFSCTSKEQFKWTYTCCLISFVSFYFIIILMFIFNLYARVYWRIGPWTVYKELTLWKELLKIFDVEFERPW